MEKIELPRKGYYYHYKHDPQGSFNNYSYEVIGIGRNTEEKTFTVLYRPLYENDWMKPADYQSRPLDMFVENVTKDEITIPRFQLITDPEIISKLEAIKLEMYGGTI
jgi:hypothetical protein